MSLLKKTLYASLFMSAFLSACSSGDNNTSSVKGLPESQILKPGFTTSGLNAGGTISQNIILSNAAGSNGAVVQFTPTDKTVAAIDATNTGTCTVPAFQNTCTAPAVITRLSDIDKASTGLNIKVTGVDKYGNLYSTSKSTAAVTTSNVVDFDTPAVYVISDKTATFNVKASDVSDASKAVVKLTSSSKLITFKQADGTYSDTLSVTIDTTAGSKTQAVTIKADKSIKSLDALITATVTGKDSASKDYVVAKKLSVFANNTQAFIISANGDYLSTKIATKTPSITLGVKTYAPVATDTVYTFKFGSDKFGKLPTATCTIAATTNSCDVTKTITDPIAGSVVVIAEDANQLTNNNLVKVNIFANQAITLTTPASNPVPGNTFDLKATLPTKPKQDVVVKFTSGDATKVKFDNTPDTYKECTVSKDNTSCTVTASAVAAGAANITLTATGNDINGFAYTMPDVTPVTVQ